MKNSEKCLWIQVKRCVVLEKWVDGCKGGGSGNSDGGKTSLSDKKGCWKISCSSLTHHNPKNALMTSGYGNMTTVQYNMLNLRMHFCDKDMIMMTNHFFHCLWMMNIPSIIATFRWKVLLDNIQTKDNWERETFCSK